MKSLVPTAAEKIKVCSVMTHHSSVGMGKVQMANSPYMTGGLAGPASIFDRLSPQETSWLYDFSAEQSLLRAASLELLALGDPIGPDAEDDDPESDKVSGQSESVQRSEGEPEVLFGGGRNDSGRRSGVGLELRRFARSGDRCWAWWRGPGALSATGVREKTIALAIALEIEKALSGESDLEVHMIRAEDRYVDVWARFDSY